MEEKRASFTFSPKKAFTANVKHQSSGSIKGLRSVSRNSDRKSKKSGSFVLKLLDRERKIDKNRLKQTYSSFWEAGRENKSQSRPISRKSDRRISMNAAEEKILPNNPLKGQKLRLNRGEPRRLSYLSKEMNKK